MVRYQVQFKAFRTGEWYTKTDTDFVASAWAIAKIGNFGRACRLIDSQSGKVLYETKEDPDFKKVNGNIDKL